MPPHSQLIAETARLAVGLLLPKFRGLLVEPAYSRVG